MLVIGQRVSVSVKEIPLVANFSTTSVKAASNAMVALLFAFPLPLRSPRSSIRLPSAVSHRAKRQ